jgi:glutathione S-transferase
VIKLYRARYSTNCERVALALAYKGLTAESVWIEYSDRSEVERVSGQGLVPVIDDGGTVVSDSPAILRHLEERYPEPPLWPAGAARRAELDTFTDWFNLVWKRWPNEIESVFEEPARVAPLAAELEAALDRFEALLDGRPYLFGDELSAADLIAFPFLRYALAREPDDDELFHQVLDRYQTAGPRLAAWIRRMDELPRA